MPQLKTMTNEQRKAKREAWEDQHYTKKIDCFFHKDESHQATVFQFGHRYAGVIECDKTGESDSCEHEELEVEDAVRDYYDPSDKHGHGQDEFQVYVCAECGVQVDGDPVEDAHDPDWEYEQSRDNEL